MLKWLTNTQLDPVIFDAYLGESQFDAKRRHQEFLRGKVIGEPRPTERYDQYELRQMGLVGVYVYVEETEEEKTQRFNDFISGKTERLGEL